MTTTPIPDAAIEAAAEAIAGVHTSCDCPECVTAYAQAALAAAIPHLGETRTQWATVEPGRKSVHRSEIDARTIVELSADVRLYRRDITTITGPWTEAEK